MWLRYPGDVNEVAAFTQLSPAEAATRILAGADASWARRFAAEIDRREAAGRLERLTSRWQLSNAAAAEIFGVSRQAFSKWLANGPPAEREGPIADLDAATELLERYLRPDRIPAVVRRPASALGGQSLLQLARSGNSAEVLNAVRTMFDLRRVQP
jgi:hypothetical protein